MSQVETLADQLERSFHGGAWHGPAVAEALAGVDAAAAAARPIAGGHSIWEIVHHLTVWTDVPRRRIDGEGLQDLPAERDWPPVRETSAGAWSAALAALEEAHAALRARVGESRRRAARRSGRRQRSHGAGDALGRRAAQRLSRRTDRAAAQGRGRLRLTREEGAPSGSPGAPSGFFSAPSAFAALPSASASAPSRFASAPSAGAAPPSTSETAPSASESAPSRSGTAPSRFATAPRRGASSPSRGRRPRTRGRKRKARGR